MSECVKCGGKVVGRGLCRRHYQQAWKSGAVRNFKVKSTPLADRLMAKTHKDESGCWLFQGHKNYYGYGLIWHNGKAIRAHRASYEAFIGPLSSDDVVCHRCDVPQCINPAHLFVGTRLDNNRDAKAKGRNAFGERNGHCKIPDAEVIKIRQSPESQSAMAKRYGVNPSTISDIKRYAKRKRVASG